jgi:hypothetical protein
VRGKPAPDSIRGTETGYEVWYARGDSEALHPRRGVLYESGVYAWNVLSLTPGGLHGVYR